MDQAVLRRVAIKIIVLDVAACRSERHPAWRKSTNGFILFCLTNIFHCLNPSLRSFLYWWVFSFPSPYHSFWALSHTQIPFFRCVRIYSGCIISATNGRLSIEHEHICFNPFLIPMVREWLLKGVWHLWRISRNGVCTSYIMRYFASSAQVFFFSTRHVFVGCTQRYGRSSHATRHALTEHLSKTLWIYTPARTDFSLKRCDLVSIHMLGMLQLYTATYSKPLDAAFFLLRGAQLPQNS